MSSAKKFRPPRLLERRGDREPSTRRETTRAGEVGPLELATVALQRQLSDNPMVWGLWPEGARSNATLWIDMSTRRWE